MADIAGVQVSCVTVVFPVDLGLKSGSSFDPSGLDRPGRLRTY